MKLDRPKYSPRHFQSSPQRSGKGELLWTRLKNEASLIPVQAWLVAVVAAVGIGYMLPVLFKFALAGVVAAVAMVVTAMQPKKALYGVWLLLVFEGAIRKWVFPGAQEFIYFGKDVFVAGIYLGVLLRDLRNTESRIEPIPAVLRNWIGLVVVYMVLELFNPRLVSQFLGLFGLRNYIFYLPLPLVVPYLFAGRADLYKFLKFNFAVAAGVCMLGALQYSLPTDHVLNQYANDLHQIDVAGFAGSERPRITGTFSYLTGFTSYLTYIGILLFPFVFASGGRARYAYLGLLIAVAGNLMMSGGRGPILLLILAGPPFVYLATTGLKNLREAKIIRVRLLTRLALGSALLFLGSYTFLKEPLDSVTARFVDNQDESGRIEGLYTDPFEVLDEVGLFGWGPAMTHQARYVILRLTRTYGQMPPPGEDEPLRIMKEIGLAGFVIWYTLRFMFIVWTLQLIAREKDGFYRLVLIAILLLQGASLPTQTVINHTQLFLYWFVLACVRVPPTAPVLAKRRRKYLL